MDYIYKIECCSKEAVDIVTDVISDARGDFIVEGFAVITDHIFNILQAGMVIECIAFIRPYESLSDKDLDDFFEKFPSKQL